MMLTSYILLTRKISIYFFIFFLSSLYSCSAFACFTPDIYAYDPFKQIERSTEVYVATYLGHFDKNEKNKKNEGKALVAPPFQNDFNFSSAQFEVTETIKGKPKEFISFHYTRQVESPIEQVTPYHDSLNFWFGDWKNGRLNSTCAYSFQLVKGQNYLVTKKGDRITALSAQPLRARNDLYYLYAKKYLTKREILNTLLYKNLYIVNSCDNLKSKNNENCKYNNDDYIMLYNRYEEFDTIFQKYFRYKKIPFNKILIYGKKVYWSDDEFDDYSVLPHLMIIDKELLSECHDDTVMSRGRCQRKVHEQ